MPTLFACNAYLPYSFDILRIVPDILQDLLPTYSIKSSVRLALESGVFPSVLPLDCHGADVARLTCVPA